MRPASFEIVSGNNEVFEITLQLNVDLTGHSDPQMQVRTDDDHPEVALEPSITIADATTGTVAIHAPEADVTDLRGVYVFDARTTVSGERVVIMVGSIEFLQGKTYDLP